MTKPENIQKASTIVSRLILQYQEYMALAEEIKILEDQKLSELNQISTKENKDIISLLASQDDFERIKKLNIQILLLQRDLQQISDEMTFANHLIWMMYKYKAYLGKVNEISDLKRFRTHCSPEGYICTERYKFLQKYLLNKYNIDINDKTKFPDEMELKKFYCSDLMISLLDDLEFLELWKTNEYLKSDSKINKWNTVK